MTNVKKPIVTLIDYTKNAAVKLIFTKNTRLEMSPDELHNVNEWDWDQINEQLEYMSRTIPSSWEFVSYTFMIQNVTRAFTHQFVRTRQGSYAQQTMRVLEMANFSYRIPPALVDIPGAVNRYIETMADIQRGYDHLIQLGCKPEDARGVLPTNIHTNICARFNLRTLSEMARSRMGLRTQDEYREILGLMIDCVLDVNPWAKHFLFPKNTEQIERLEKLVSHCEELGINKDQLDTAKKDLDALRKSS